MRRILGRPCVLSGLLTVVVALAPAPQSPPQTQEAPNRLMLLAKARAESAARTFDLAWLYYSENRIEAGDVYSYSRLRLMAEQDMATDKAERVGAARGHLDRMERLWKKVSRVKKLGFSNTLDVNEAEYYTKEADYWLAREQAWEDK